MIIKLNINFGFLIFCQLKIEDHLFKKKNTSDYLKSLEKEKATLNLLQIINVFKSTYRKVNLV